MNPRTTGLQSQQNDHIRRHILHQGSQITLLVCRSSLLIAFVIFLWALIFPSGRETPPLVEASAPILSQPTPTLIPTPVIKWGVGVSNRPLVGLISGHAGSDSGAVCPDGVSEVDINRAVTLEVANLLAQQQVRTNIFEEFDDRLNAYQADVLLSLHADSCNVPGASGFKVARSAVSAIPEIEDLMVNCLVNEYAKFTQLPVHANSVTHDMLHYHAFHKVAFDTPAAIIELGFMLEDRYLLEHRPNLLAQGVAAGILCFLQTD